MISSIIVPRGTFQPILNELSDNVLAQQFDKHRDHFIGLLELAEGMNDDHINSAVETVFSENSSSLHDVAALQPLIETTFRKRYENELTDSLRLSVDRSCSEFDQLAVLMTAESPTFLSVDLDPYTTVERDCAVACLEMACRWSGFSPEWDAVHTMGCYGGVDALRELTGRFGRRWWETLPSEYSSVEELADEEFCFFGYQTICEHENVADAVIRLRQLVIQSVITFRRGRDLSKQAENGKEILKQTIDLPFAKSRAIRNACLAITEFSDSKDSALLSCFEYDGPDIDIARVVDCGLGMMDYHIGNMDDTHDAGELFTRRLAINENTHEVFKAFNQANVLLLDLIIAMMGSEGLNNR